MGFLATGPFTLGAKAKEAGREARVATAIVLRRIFQSRCVKVVQNIVLVKRREDI
jgi:hypothetical protein